MTIFVIILNLIQITSELHTIDSQRNVWLISWIWNVSNYQVTSESLKTKEKLIERNWGLDK